MARDLLTKKHWSARSLIREISESSWKNPGIDTKYQKFFMSDLFSEYDSINLYHYLYPGRAKLSAHAVQFLDFWYADERNHADGFLELNKFLFEVNEESIINELKARTGCFRELEDFLADEFSMLILFAYDELTSVKAYQKDKFYNDFGHPNFTTWAKNLIADEAIHYGNAIKILKINHRQRLHEAEDILYKIKKLEQNAYQRTFLLDHDGAHFTLSAHEYGDAIAKEILSTLRKI